MRVLAAMVVSEFLALAVALVLVLAVMAMALHWAQPEESVAYLVTGTTACALASLAVAVVRARKDIRYGLLTGCAVFCAAFSFFVLVPVTIERSISVYLLDRMAGQPEGISEAALTTMFEEQYVQGDGAIAKRIREQRAAGNVAVVKEGFALSAAGMMQVRMFDWLRAVFCIPVAPVERER